jgi:phosphoribosylanthranilate isomerase
VAGLDVLMRVKICGLCDPADARDAVAAGADYAGVVLHGESVRRQADARARAIFDAAAGASRVGVFVDAPLDDVLGAATSLRLDIVQLHGSEDLAFVVRLRAGGPWRVWKAVRPRSADEFLAAVETYGEAVDGMLLDGWSARAAGGTGASFSWKEIAVHRDRLPRTVQLVAAGGLRPDNVGVAVAVLRPDVVDVSSGVESAVGRKSAALIRAFIANARGVPQAVPGG